MLVRSIGSVACFAVANDIHVVVRVHPRVRTSQPICPVLPRGATCSHASARRQEMRRSNRLGAFFREKLLEFALFWNSYEGS